MTQAFIGLGSNLRSPRDQLARACASLASHTEITLVETSPLSWSEAVGPGEQDDYLNGVAHIETSMEAETLLNYLHSIEDQQERKREIRWGARTLDLDLLLFGDEDIRTEKLTVPHPRIAERNFVLQPLFDIAPAASLPKGQSVASLLKHVNGGRLTPADK